MQFLVLVAYATRSGSTKELALVLAEALRADGIATEERSVREIEELGTFGAVILCAALYMGRLHKDARRFLAMHREELSKLPVALFVPGPVRKEAKDWTGAEQQLDQELARMPWLSPVTRHIVGGRFDPAKMGFPWNVLLRRIPVIDARDWPSIRIWADELAGRLQPSLDV